MNTSAFNPILLLITLAFILSAFLLARASARHQEGVMGTLAVIGLVLLAGGIGFTAMNYGAAGPLILGVQFAGLAILVLMLWRHWTGRPGMWLR